MKLLNYFIAAGISIAASTISSSSLSPTIAMAEESGIKTEITKPVVQYKKMWKLPLSSYNEIKVLNALQERGIKDRNALATVMGNIKQESKFKSNICEGGARVSYFGCRSGGYGLIQWTSSDRYHGLGRHAFRNGLDPSTSEAQVSFLFTERQWISVEPFFKRDGQSIDFYMGKAYYWLGWGIHGNRTTYALQYASKLISVEVPI